MSESRREIAEMVAKAAEGAPLVIVCGDGSGYVHGKLTRVFLKGQDISHQLTKVEVLFDCDKPVGARLEYVGAAVIVSDGAEVEFKQADVHVACSECQKTLRGESEPVVIAKVAKFGRPTSLVADVDEAQRPVGVDG